MPKSSSSSSSSSGSSSSSSSSGSSSSSSEDEHEQRKDEGQSRKRKLDPESSTDNKKASNNSDPPPISREAGAPAAGGVTVNTPGADEGGDKSDDDIGPQPAPTSEVSAEVGEANAEVAKEGRQDEIVMVPQKKKKGTPKHVHSPWLHCFKKLTNATRMTNDASMLFDSS